MPVGRDSIRGPVVLVLLFLLVLSLTGCDLTIEEPQATQVPDGMPSALSTGVVQLPLYDAAVSAIDFDPPLKRDLLLTELRSVKLLAAVENRGTMPLAELSVEARLSSEKGELLARDVAHVDTLSPGETKVVEFQRVVPASGLPKSSSYRVSVTVGSKEPDSNLQNNSREVIVRVVE